MINKLFIIKRNVRFMQVKLYINLTRTLIIFNCIGKHKVRSISDNKTILLLLKCFIFT